MLGKPDVPNPWSRMLDYILWHNPKCSKSRAALALLHERGVEPAVVDYLRHPPHADEIARVAAALGSARALLRDAEPEYAELGLGASELDDAALVAAMAAHPKLIQRPVLILGDQAEIGRPTERLLRLLPS